jgi:hypothetical protein
MPWYMTTNTRSTWHVVDQICNGKRTLRSHRLKGDAVLQLQRNMREKVDAGCTLRPLSHDQVAVFRDGIPIGWIGYQQCTKLLCSGCDALETAA